MPPPGAREPDVVTGGLSQQAQLQSEMGGAGRKAWGAAGLGDSSQTACIKRRGRLQKRYGKQPDGGHAEERQLKAGFEKLAGIVDQVNNRHGGQQIQQTAPAIEVARGNVERESAGGADSRRVQTRNQRINPRTG